MYEHEYEHDREHGFFREHEIKHGTKNYLLELKWRK